MLKTTLRYAIPLLLAASVTACSRDADPVETASTEASPPASVETVPTPANTQDLKPLVRSTALPAKMDCVREIGALAAAHRGGPRRGFPENALETLEESYKRGTRIFEIDIAESKDGVLFLMHDVELDHTTTGKGVAREMDWSDLSTLNLTANGEDTAFLIPTLRQTLDWAVANNAIVELDKKRSTEFATIIKAVREADATNNVILITYTYDQAEDVAELAPDMMMTATVEDPSDLEELIRRGVKLENLIAWTGTSTPNPGLWLDRKARGVEVAFGTLGRRNERLDDQYWADDDGTEYNVLENNGVTMIATDYSDKVTRQLTNDDIAIKACGF